MRDPRDYTGPDRPLEYSAMTTPIGPDFFHRRVLVVGLGRFGGGLGVTRWLVEQGAIVTVTDHASAESLSESVEALRGLPVTLHLGGHDDADLDSTELVIINPAVLKFASTYFREIVRRKIEWTTEMNLFCERCPATVVGVTGTFGKSTTCAMLFEVFEAARLAGGVAFRAVHLGGNIGRSLLTELPNIDARDLVVLEMSNAQLEDLPRIRWTPNVAVLTNLYPHHLDRYAGFSEYIQAKLNIARALSGKGPLITGPLHGEVEPLLAAAVAATRRVRVTSMTPPAELFVPGEHNQANAACAATVASVMGLEGGFVRDILRSFRGLPHRLEFVRTIQGVDYFNDSKSTAPPATVVAVRSMSRRLVTIVGGQRKDVPLREMVESLETSCRAVVCMGESGPIFAEAIRATATAVHVVQGLEEAVPLAKTLAQPGDAVLFSPGAPSFDQYGNFTERGRHFVETVGLL